MDKAAPPGAPHTYVVAELETLIPHVRKTSAGISYGCFSLLAFIVVVLSTTAIHRYLHQPKYMVLYFGCLTIPLITIIAYAFARYMLWSKLSDSLTRYLLLTVSNHDLESMLLPFAVRHITPSILESELHSYEKLARRSRIRAFPKPWNSIPWLSVMVFDIWLLACLAWFALAIWAVSDMDISGVQAAVLLLHTVLATLLLTYPPLVFTESGIKMEAFARMLLHLSTYNDHLEPDV